MTEPDRCEDCGGARCTECWICISCSIDGHDEGCSRQGDEYAELVQAMRGPVVYVEPERLSSPYECLAAE